MFFQIVKNQRQFNETNKPASLDHRREQLVKLREMIVKNETVLIEAVFKVCFFLGQTHKNDRKTKFQDLRRDTRLTRIVEITPALTEVDYCLANLHKWASNDYVEKTLVTLFDTPYIAREPLGVCLLMAPWNYPILMVLLPLITMMAAGKFLNDFTEFRKN